MKFAEDLLEQAYHLSSREPGKPRQASLRRAISTTYYALFHLSIDAAAKNWKWPHHRSTFARSFDHRFMHEACRRARTSANANVRMLAMAFNELQQQRHLADYDNSRKWTRAEASHLIRKTEGVFATWDLARKDADVQDFLLTLFVRQR